jgi:hypothetical protein
MAWEHQRIRNHNILSPTRSKHHNLCNILWCKRITPLIDLLGRINIASKSHDRELSLDLAGVNLDDADAGVDQFAAEGIGEGTDGGFCAAVN